MFQVTVDKLKELFSEKGEVTDVQLKYTKDGKFRNFGFIGYRNQEQATEARDFFNGTCINSMKIEVQTCANLGDEKKPKAWSKYATDSSAYKKLHKDEIEAKEQLRKTEKKERKIEKNKNKIKELLKKVNKCTLSIFIGVVLLPDCCKRRITFFCVYDTP